MRSSGVHHVDLIVSDVERSLAFYRELLGPLVRHDVSNQRGERGETHPLPLRAGFLDRAPRVATEAVRASRRRYRVGLHHVCLEVAERAELDRSAERLRGLDATITDDPRQFPEYREGYYALYSRTPTGSSSSSSGTPEGTYDDQRIRSR